MKKLIMGWPERAFAGYAILMLLLLAGMWAGRAIVCLVAFEVLSLPVGWLLGFGGWYSLLPDGVQYFVAYLAALANGALFYSLLKTIRRRPHIDPEEPIQPSETTRGK